MPYVPGCQYDLFISYASENNRAGWIRMFEEVLTGELEELLGRQFSGKSVFFDRTGLRAGQSFPETLEKAAEASAVLIPVLSPSYLTSDWCYRERLAFLRSLPAGAGENECLAPVQMRPIDESLLDPLLRNAQRLSFLQPNTEEPWPAGSPEWTAAVKSLATQLKIVLEQLRRKCRPVFVGRALAGREEVRALCAAELEKRLFRVAPLPTLDTKESLTQAAQQAVLSVHFIGGASDESRLAADIAAQICPGATILYKPFAARITTDEALWLDEFERTLRPDPSSYQRIEDKNDQELVAILEQEITRIRPAPVDGIAELTVICGEADLGLARRLRQEIQTRERLTVSYPEFLEGPLFPSERSRKFAQLLKSSPALLFCWGQAKEETLLKNLEGRASAGAPHEWYLTEPDMARKRQEFPNAICQTGEFRYDLLAPFLQPLRRNRQATQ